MRPNFENLRKVLLREGIPEYLPFYELFVDSEVIEAIMNEKFTSDESKEARYHNANLTLSFYHKMGYDYVPGLCLINFPGKTGLIAADTAKLSREGGRSWADEHHGVIESWEDFEKYPWDDLYKMDFWICEFYQKNLPDGMKVIAHLPSGIFENLSRLMSYEKMCYMLYEEPELVEAITKKLGDIMVMHYELILDFEFIGAALINDDLGYKTGTLISPEMLRKFVFPQHKRLSETVHKHNLPVILHCCGNIEKIMPDLIEDVRIDARHSFEDVITPVTEAKRLYGDRIAILGGIDVDKLSTLPEDELRRYVRKIIDGCAPGGGYALGSGNSVANYVKVENYLAMLEEGRKWSY